MKNKQSSVIRAAYTISLMLILMATGPANAALIARGADMVYDDVLDITWLTNASALGTGNWDNQVNAAANYSIDYNGTTYDDWRLASMSVSALNGSNTTTSVVDCSSASEVDCRDNELGYMFYQNMGGNLFDDKIGTQIVDGVTFTDIQSFYWSGTEFNSNNAWEFNFDNGNQNNNNKNNNNAGWAVRSGA